MLASLLLTAVMTTAPSARSTVWVPLVKLGPEFGSRWKRAIETGAEVSLKQKRRTKAKTPPSSSVEDLVVALGCSKWGPSCAHEIGTMLGAQRALVIEIAAKGEGAAIKIQLIGKKARVLRSAGPYLLPDRSDVGLKRAQKTVRAFINNKLPTELVVTSTSRAKVKINRKSYGSTPLKLVSKFAPGALLKISVTRKGMKSQKIQLRLEAGATRQLKIELEKVEPKVAVVKPPDEAVGDLDKTSVPDSKLDAPDANVSDTVTAGSGAEKMANASESGGDSSTSGGQKPASDLTGVTGEGTRTLSSAFPPILVWAGAGALAASAAGALATASPWLAVVGGSLTNGCVPVPKVKEIEFQCPKGVVASKDLPVLEGIHWFPVIGLPIAGTIAAVGVGLLASGILLGGDELMEGPEDELAEAGENAAQNAPAFAPQLRTVAQLPARR